MVAPRPEVFLEDRDPLTALLQHGEAVRRPDPLVDRGILVAQPPAERGDRRTIAERAQRPGRAAPGRAEGREGFGGGDGVVDVAAED